MDWKTTSKLHLKNVSHLKLIPNSFAVQIASSANEFSQKTKFLLQKSCFLKQHHPKINESPCFCIQIRMSPHRSASFPEFRPTKLSKTSQHSHHASLHAGKRSTCTQYARECIFFHTPFLLTLSQKTIQLNQVEATKAHTCCQYVSIAVICSTSSEDLHTKSHLHTSCRCIAKNTCVLELVLCLYSLTVSTFSLM